MCEKNKQVAQTVRHEFTPSHVTKICPDCRGRLGKLSNSLLRFEPCKTCYGIGFIEQPNELQHENIHAAYKDKAIEEPQQPKSVEEIAAILGEAFADPSKPHELEDLTRMAERMLKRELKGG